MNKERLDSYLIKKKIKKRDRLLLLEAYRRFMMFANGKTLETAWVGLGTPSEYKSDYFTSIEIPKVLNWYRLSIEGINIMKKMLSANPIPKRFKAIEKLNTELF